MNIGVNALFRMDGISKRYGGVRALDDARLACFSGRIHAVLGENGAGKSTLIKVMAGVVQPDSGMMEFEGRTVGFRNPAAATDAGIGCIFQELSLVADLSVADNVAITRPPTRIGLIDRRSQRRLTEEALARAGAEGIHPLSLVKDLPLSRRQMVEIAKALDNLCGGDLFHAIGAISRVWVDFGWFQQPNLMVVAQRFDAQMDDQGKVPDAQCIAHSERFSCRLVYVLLVLERRRDSPPTGEYILL